MIVGPNTLEENDMDETNTVLQVPGVQVDTGPTPLDVLEAQLVLRERAAMDQAELLRQALQEHALDYPARRLADVVLRISELDTQVQLVRSLRRDSQL